MKIAILAETAAGEARCAMSAEMAVRYVKLGVELAIESGAGEASNIANDAFEKAGATVMEDRALCLDKADMLLCVNAPDADTLALIQPQTMVIGMLSPLSPTVALSEYTSRNITAFAMELLPRISRAQSMDVLSSQSNLAGYRAVIEAANAHSILFPMLMTSAGTIPPAKVLVLGAGVAGLQAVATAKRLGAVVSAFDVRPAVKEQVESLGGKFIEVPVDAEQEAETSGGYAKEMSEDYKRKQAELVHKTAIKHDIIITTALIPGKPAPELISKATVEAMKTGSVIVDLAAAAGGNCPLTKADKVTEKHGVKLIGYTNLPARAAQSATPLYARNLFTFVSTLLMDADGNAHTQWDDELVAGTLIARDGQITHPMLSKSAAA